MRVLSPWAYESEVTIAIDSLQDVGALASSFARFSDQFPHTRVRVLETTLSGTTEALLERKADLVITPRSPRWLLGSISARCYANSCGGT